MYQFDLKGFSIDFSLNLLNPKIPRGRGRVSLPEASTGERRAENEVRHKPM